MNTMETASSRRILIGGVPVDAVTFAGALDAIEALVRDKRGGTVFTPNVDHIVIANEDERLRAAYAEVSLSLADGMPVLWAARLLKRPLPAKVSGSDLVLPLAKRAAERGWRVYLLGGANGVAERVKVRLERDLPGIQIVGTSSPRINLDAPLDMASVEVVRETNPDLVLVAFGAPKQEIWSEKARATLSPAVLVGVGGSFDFLVGEQKRAPEWMSRSGLEWLYRLGSDPKRLWRRYLLRDPKFAVIVARQLREQRWIRKRAIVWTLGLATVFAAFLAFEYRYVRYAAAWTHPSRRAISTAQRDDAHARLPTLAEVAFTTSDGVELRGWYVPSRNGAVVVMGHGLAENRVRFLPDAEFLARHGYGTLFFDWRANGESGGDIATWGDREQLDLSAAVDFASKQPDVVDGRLAAAGFSIGAAAVAMGASNDPRIRAVILLAVWTSLEDELNYKFRRYGFLSRWPALEGFRREGVRLDAVRPVDAVGRIAPRPILFIGGSIDSDTPPWVMDRMYAAAGEPKRRWTAEGAEHGSFRDVAPADYERVIVSFHDDTFFPASRQ